MGSHTLLARQVVVFTRLPYHLHAGVNKFFDPRKHTFVYRSGAKATAQHQQRLTVIVETEMLKSRAALTVEMDQVFPYRIARQHHLLAREVFFHAFISDAHAVHFSRNLFVRDSGEGVLFLDDRLNAATV